MDAKRLVADPKVLVGLLTLFCFFLTSTGWLVWLYHLTDIAVPESVDMLTMVVGYLMQAMGIGTFVATYHWRRQFHGRRLRSCFVMAYVACLVPATRSTSLAPSLAFGYLANLLCGYLQGYYLLCLARSVDKAYRGRVFGGAYAASAAAGWLISLAPSGTLTQGVGGLLTCAALAVPTALLVGVPLPRNASGDDENTSDEAASRAPVAPSLATGAETNGARVGHRAPRRDLGLIPLACVTVALMSLVKGAGFSFPTTDLVAGIDIELSRLLYGTGLLLAGIVCDRSRRYGSLCCGGALVTPFLMLALSGAEAPATVLWALGYLLFGFFSVYRVVLLADLADDMGKSQLAGLGLAFGRVGDAAGTALSAALSGMPLVLITVAAALFAVATLCFFMLDQQLFVPSPEATPSEHELFELFAARHDLSAREREVLRLVLKGNSNGEIAAQLFVSEATVKFHVRNLLKKTGCKNRMEMLAVYAERG